MGQALDKASLAREASFELVKASAEVRSKAISAAASLMRENAAQVVAANALDMDRARKAGMKESLLDRLYLDEARVRGIADAMDEVAAQADPIGRVLDGYINADGLRIEKVTVPLGVVAMVYEARPNVTADAFALCMRAGNACLLKGGSAANASCMAIAELCRRACVEAALPADSVAYIEDDAEHTQTAELLGAAGLVDVLIPRGGAGLIQTCVQNAKVPTIETGTGNCHIYVHADADLNKAIPILLNAKTQRIGVCNAAESLLVDEAIADVALPKLVGALADAGVLVHGDEAARAAAKEAGALEHFEDATEDDWGREYLALELSVRVVSGLDEAIAHINRYGTRHSEAIVTESYAAAERFLNEVDASTVYVNASTRFTDGGVFGLGGEIGISTQKLHVRGPMGAGALTSTKYLVRGWGQTR
ncbi:glutamate-5-semialdehyde dehydrogenase [Paratractidigestivibacter sp.]|uniref:glutamate-5-semialdehyde dehydrogenase n=1 Tax=Paratractidigestivibacter sp. TaxID=2847316 RepID=UPI002ABD262A|nr:glutamate-5-semialdehyde dehydrogenase [Paratractidigestivibacter sp.]